MMPMRASRRHPHDGPHDRLTHDNGVAELEFHVFDPHDIHIDGDVVLVELTLDVSHRATGKRARFEEIHHWIVRDGLVVHFRPYADTAALIELYRPD